MEDAPTSAIASGVEEMFHRLYMVAPVSTVIIAIAAIGYFACWWLQKKHIASLKEQIEYMKQKS